MAGLAEAAPADAVIYDADPRLDLSQLATPAQSCCEARSGTADPKEERMDVHGHGNNLYRIVEGGREGWQALIRNGLTWTDTGYYGATLDEVLRKLRNDGKIP
jgi:hypothetical protein